MEPDVPKVGLEFGSSDEAYKFYEEYGRIKGFDIRIRSSIKGWARVDETTACKFVCIHEGSYTQNLKEGESSKVRSTSTQRMGCKAKMRILKDKVTKKWKISIFSDEHNHGFVSPSKGSYLRCNKNFSAAAKNLVDVFNRENLQINKVTAVLSGDTVGFNDRDCWNYLRSVRHRNLSVGDAQSVLNYFQNRQLENPQFFYAIQCDEDGRATNFFWVDAYSRMSYRQFGDVVTFDTTYRTNKYEMPFAPFTGESEHRFRIVNEHNLILVHASRLYTRTMFGKFKDQLNDIIKFRVEEKNMEGDFHVYVVQSKTHSLSIAPEKFIVKLNLETHEGNCECFHYEFVGIPCRHLLVVFNRQDIDEIPNHFILKRWTQGANRFKANEGNLLSKSEVHSKTLRLSHLCRESTQLSFLAHHSETGYRIVIEGIRELVRKVSLLEFEEDGPREDNQICPEKGKDLASSSPPQYLLNPNVSQTKGRKKDNEKSASTGRIKSSIELAQKKKRKCHLCNELGHDKRICPKNPNKKKVDDGMEIDDDEEIEVIGD